MRFNRFHVYRVELFWFLQTTRKSYLCSITPEDFFWLFLPETLSDTQWISHVPRRLNEDAEECVMHSRTISDETSVSLAWRRVNLIDA